MNGMDLDLAEAMAEGDVLGVAQVLVREEEHEVLEPGLANRLPLAVVQSRRGAHRGLRRRAHPRGVERVSS